TPRIASALAACPCANFVRPLYPRANDGSHTRSRSLMPNAAEIVPDYLLIGHITHDVTPYGPHLGGTVSFAAHTAAAFGLKVALLTSAAPDEPLMERLPDSVMVVNIPAEHTTTIENIYTPDGRDQYMYHRARTLEVSMLPPAWRNARQVHFA